MLIEIRERDILNHVISDNLGDFFIPKPLNSQ